MSSVVSRNTGPAVIGTFINVFLYTLEVVQCYVYFCVQQRWRQDFFLIKAAVVVGVTSDTVGTAACCATVYNVAVTNWGSIEGLDSERDYWASVLLVITNGICEAVAQAFMAFRYWSLSHNRIVLAFIGVAIVTGFVGTILTAVNLGLFTTLTDRADLVFRYAIAGYSGVTAANILITVALLWKLGTLQASSQLTKNVVKHISLLAITSGCIPLLLTTSAFIVYGIYPETQFAGAVWYLVGPIYMNTMLFTLNLRNILRNETWGQDPTSLGRRRPRRPSVNVITSDLNFVPELVDEDENESERHRSECSQIRSPRARALIHESRRPDSESPEIV